MDVADAFTAANRQQTKISYRPMDDNTLKIFADRSQAEAGAPRAGAGAGRRAGPGGFRPEPVRRAELREHDLRRHVEPQVYVAAVTQAAPELAPILNGVAAAQSGGNPIAAGSRPRRRRQRARRHSGRALPSLHRPRRRKRRRAWRPRRWTDRRSRKLSDAAQPRGRSAVSRLHIGELSHARL